MFSGIVLVLAAALISGGVRSKLKGLGRKAGKGGGADRFRGSDARQEIAETHTPDYARADESKDVWGFSDTRFAVDADGVVELTGGRYTMSGQKLPYLLPWVAETMGIEVPLIDLNEPSYPPQIPAAQQNRAFMTALSEIFGADQVSQDPLERLRHGHGQTQEEMFAIKYGHIKRLPDVVVYPAEQSQVEQLVEAAQSHGVCLIPYGGGTNVTEALRCLPDEKRFIVSVDTRRMNRILWVDPINRMACIEAGAVGRHIVAALAERGFTMGHEPDSVEFSTLGGWIATHASGMKKNKYGNIEDIVLDMTVVTPTGLITRAQVVPRESIGTDPRAAVFGSEGNMGIITQAVVKLFPLPEAQKFGSVLFPSFEGGVGFMYDLTQANAAPASVRLMDNVQFQLGQALKPAKAHGFALLKSQLEKAFVVNLRGFEPDRMVAATLVFEGTAREVEAQEQAVYAIAKQHRGMKAGAENGERGYQLTYGIAYIRDFVMRHYILAESFETSVPWSRVLELCDRVKRRVRQEHTARGLPGKPLVTCRVTQVYATGVAVYFYFAYFYKGVERPSEIYAELETAAREEILACGGSLSHHHGIGKLRRQFLPAIMSSAALAWRDNTKKAIDPHNVFGCGNISPDN